MYPHPVKPAHNPHALSYPTPSFTSKQKMLILTSRTEIVPSRPARTVAKYPIKIPGNRSAVNYFTIAFNSSLILFATSPLQDAALLKKYNTTDVALSYR